MKSGLSQREVGLFLGYNNAGQQICRHERSRTIPPLLMALCYEVLYQVPVATLFLGIHETVKQAVEKRLVEFEGDLQNRSGKSSGERAVAQKLAWLLERRRM